MNYTKRLLSKWYSEDIFNKHQGNCDKIAYEARQHQQKRIDILLEQQDRLIEKVDIKHSALISSCEDAEKLESQIESLQAQCALLEKQNTVAVNALEFMSDETITHFKHEVKATEALAEINRLRE